MGVGVGVLFISHSGRDNDAAIRVRDWLRSRGWGQVFLDLDPVHGLAPGHRWQQELKQAGERCSGVLVLLSPNWVASRWCQTEFLVADQLGKKIFPIFIAPVSFEALPIELKAKFQIVDISEPAREAEGLERLAIGLKRAGLDPGSFEWPPPGDPHRPIYRGLQSLDEEDAAIFFGRDALITKGLDALRRMRDGSPERMLVILGASGAGKSSFLKAGLIARLKRDEENFLILPVIRPERAALSGRHGLAAALSVDATKLDSSADVLGVFAARRGMVTDRLRRFAECAHESWTAEPPTIVIPIDQAEELFAAENTEAPQTLKLLAEAILADGNAIVVASIRSDNFAKMQDEPRLAEVRRLPFDLAPIPHGAFKEVVEGPARLANPPLTVEPALTEQLLNDLAAGDALPLLAFTLERLLRRHRGSGALTLSEYTHELGGLQGAISAAVESAFEKAMRDPSLPHDRAALDRLARAAFIPALVQIDDADVEPRRRVERLDALPEATRPLVRHLIAERLLVTDHRLIDGAEADTVEVAHEAILRQWPALSSWITEEHEALHVLDAVRAAARDWHAHGELQGWLTHGGGRLEETDRLLAPQHFANALSTTERNYLAACRSLDNAEHERERNEIEREKKNIARTRRLQRNIFVLIGAAVAIVLLTGFGIAELLNGIAIRSSDALAKLSEQASDNQDYEEAARYALAGLAGADWPVIGYSGLRAELALRTADALSRRISVLRGHRDTVTSGVYSPDGTRIVTASNDMTVRVWNAGTGAQIAVLRGHNAAVNSAAYSADGTRIVTASDDRTARIWDARSGKQILVLSGHTGRLTSAAYSPDDKHIVTSSSDRTARIWDTHSGVQIMVLRGHQGPVVSAAYSPDGMRIVTGSTDRTARVWDTRTGAQIAALVGHQSGIFGAAYSPDGTRIATASLDRTARVWDALTGAQIAVLHGHDDVLNSVAWSPGGERIVTASEDYTARIWDPRTASQFAILRGHDGAMESAAYSPDGTRILTASDDGTARIWDAQTGTQNAVLRGHDDSVESAAYSPDGTRVVTASLDSTARIWDTHTAKQIAILRGHQSGLSNTSYSPDGTRIATAASDKTVRIWNARSGAQIAVLRGHQGAATHAVYSPDGMRIVTASYDKTARVWDARTGACLAVLRGHADVVASAAYSPDGNRIVTASYDKTARIWDARTGTRIAELRGHEDEVETAAYSPDGTHIVTASDDKTVRIWDARTGAQIAVLRGHEARVTSASYNHDGSRIVTASDDRTARLWDARTGVQLAILRGHEGAVESAAFSPDGTRIVTASDDKTARIWKVPRTAQVIIWLPREDLVAHVCKSLLAEGLDHLSQRELAAAPNLDPELDADSCHPSTELERLRNLFIAH